MGRLHLIVVGPAMAITCQSLSLIVLLVGIDMYV